MSPWAVLLIASVTILLLPSAGWAHTPTLLQEAFGSDPEGRGHWANFHTEYHLIGSLASQAHHAGERARLLDAIDFWTSATNPDSPWHTHVNSGAPSHVAVVNSSEPGVLGVGEIAEDSNDHIPRLSSLVTCSLWDSFPNCDAGTGLWLRHDIGEVTACGPNFNQTCSWYTGVNSPGVNQVDAWGVWVEEVGHVQNISHHIPPGHSTAHGHAMDGGLCDDDPASCTMDKRSRPLTSHERDHACTPYQLEHSNC